MQRMQCCQVNASCVIHDWKLCVQCDLGTWADKNVVRNCVLSCYFIYGFEWQGIRLCGKGAMLWMVMSAKGKKYRIRKAETGKENSEEMNVKYSKAAGEGNWCWYE